MENKKRLAKENMVENSSSALILLVNISSGKITKETTQCEGGISRYWNMTLLGPIIPQVFLSDAVNT